MAYGLMIFGWVVPAKAGTRNHRPSFVVEDISVQCSNGQAAAYGSLRRGAALQRQRPRDEEFAEDVGGDDQGNGG